MRLEGCERLQNTLVLEEVAFCKEFVEIFENVIGIHETFKYFYAILGRERMSSHFMWVEMSSKA